MNLHDLNNRATSNIPAWTTSAAKVEVSADDEAGADTDEPPDQSFSISPISKHFKRGPVRRGCDPYESLLTKALQGQSDEEHLVEQAIVYEETRRRRSITSNFSLASTVDLTCDTAITTPARTSSPSPRLPHAEFGSMVNHVTTHVGKTFPLPPAAVNNSVASGTDPAVQPLAKKRCISFACAAKPPTDTAVPAIITPNTPISTNAQPVAPEFKKRISIKFACPAQPLVRGSNQPPQPVPSTSIPSGQFLSSQKGGSPATVQKSRSPSAARSHRSLTPRRLVGSRSKKAPVVSQEDLESESSRFHEFASDVPQDDDWIRRNDSTSKGKLTINDTLEKENAIRKLGKEAEEEAKLEEEELEEEENETGTLNPDDDDLDDDLEEELDDAADDIVADGSDEDLSDGYNTDNEIGFADSDDDDADGLVLWTTMGINQLSISSNKPARRRPPMDQMFSDSSIGSNGNSGLVRTRLRGRKRTVVFGSGTPGLPDNTDFVCGALDEDLSMEDAYISCMAARKREKQQLIPQDIDPSFPVSEPEDEGESDRPKGHGDSEDNIWLHGELEDLDHGQDRAGWKPSPQRCRSPPPKRLLSPPPKARGRSPKRLLDRQSPRRLRSPAALKPFAVRSPSRSPVHKLGGISFNPLGDRSGHTHTKSLPRASALFSSKGRRRTSTLTENHVRGAIDIVKGLEKKRLRRKEKFFQKYCNRARKEKAQDKRPPPGQGAERMREIGLLMAGKLAHPQGNYVLSV